MNGVAGGVGIPFGHTALKEKEMDNVINIKVTPDFSTPCADQELLGLTIEVGDRMWREVINLKEKATRDALIGLGWKPPEYKKTETLDSEELRCLYSGNN